MTKNHSLFSLQIIKLLIFHYSEGKNFEKQHQMYRFTKNYFKPMKNSVYDKRRGNGRDFELRANAGNGRAVWQKIFFGY